MYGHLGFVGVLLVVEADAEDARGARNGRVEGDGLSGMRGAFGNFALISARAGGRIG